MNKIKIFKISFYITTILSILFISISIFTIVIGITFATLIFLFLSVISIFYAIIFKKRFHLLKNNQNNEIELLKTKAIAEEVVSLLKIKDDEEKNKK